MAKAKTSLRLKRSLENTPKLKLKKGVKVLKHDSAATFLDTKLVGNALIQALRDGDAEAFKEILAAHLSVTNKDKFAAKAKLPRRTLFRMLSPDGNPTLENIARIVHAFSKVA